MTTIPTHLPGLMRSAVEAGANISTYRWPDPLGGWGTIRLRITWPDHTDTVLDWDYQHDGHGDGAWKYVSDLPLSSVRARIERDSTS